MIKNIALVAHDSRKQELYEWVKYNKEVLRKCELYATGTTGRILNDVYCEDVVNEETGTVEKAYTKEIHRLRSGPLSGDAQIGAMIGANEIDCLIFFCDNLVVQGHNNDVLGLSRLASLFNIAYATNRTTADMIISSPLFKDENYKPIIPNCISNYENRDV